MATHLSSDAGSSSPPPELPALWDLESADYECDCPGPPPPPEFLLPPPPRPPYLQELDCSDTPLPDLETCDAVPVIDAEYHSSPAIPSLAVIVVCSVLLLAMVLIASILVWKHKRKMQNFLPCKTSPQNRCDVTNGNGVIYEDLTNIRPRAMPNHCPPGQTAPSIEMIDVKSASNYNTGFSVIGNPSVFICPPPHLDPYTSQDLYNPVYEELSNGSGDRGDSDPDSEECRGQAPLSEDEFAEDELSLGGGEGDAGHPQAGPQCPAECPPHSGNSSLQGSTGNDLCRDLDSSDADDRSRFLTSPQGQGLVPGRNFSLPPGCRTRTSRGLHPHQHRGPAPDPRRPSRSLDRRRGWRGKPSPNQQPSPPSPAHGEFHEGLLLDALLQMYPNVVTVGGTPLVSGRINNRGAVPGGGGHHHAVPSVTHRLPYILPTPSPAPTRNHLVNPYESVPVLNHLHQHHHGYGPTRHPEMFTTFRPAGGGKANSQDSSFGSDSGYSNNTSGGRTTSSRGRKDAHRHSAHSGELTLS